jgi:hypothetical protein
MAESREVHMLRKRTRTGIAGVVLAAAAVAATGLPAQAQAKPALLPGYEYVVLYYSNAQHTDNIGAIYFGCFSSSWGSRSMYTSEYSYPDC